MENDKSFDDRGIYFKVIELFYMSSNKLFTDLIKISIGTADIAVFNPSPEEWETLITRQGDNVYLVSVLPEFGGFVSINWRKDLKQYLLLCT